MTRRCVNVLVGLSLVFLSLSVHAVEFQSLGFDALSMGGAGVASSSGPFAPYYNPALLPEHKHKLQVSISAMAGYREVNVAEHIDALSEIDIEDTIDQLATGSGIDYSNLPTSAPNVGDSIPVTAPTDVKNDVSTIKRELRALSVQNGIQLMPSVCLGIQNGNIGVGAYGVSEATAHAVIDPNRLDLIYEHEDGGQTYYIEYNDVNNTFIRQSQAAYEARSFEYAIGGEGNTTYLQLTGLAYLEIPISYGHKFNTEFGELNCGGSFKLMPGYTYDYKSRIDTESGDISDELEDYQEKDTAYGVDLGLLFKPKTLSRLSIGLVGKNLNTPEFDKASGGTMEVDPQLRTGAAYDFPGGWVTLAFDADLTNNDTFIPGYNAQFMGGGINFHPFNWLSLRGGLMKNLKESDEGTILTAGLGLGAKWLQLDVAAQYSTEDGEYDGEKIPRYGKVQVALVSKWF